MTANVVSLRGDLIDCDRKAQFLETLAESLDIYIRTYGEPPDALVFTLGGVGRPTQSRYHTEGRSDDCSRAAISQSILALTKMLMVYDG